MSITPAAGKTRNGSIAATAHGIGCAIHHAMTQANVASATRPWYSSASGSVETMAKTSGPDSSLSTYAAVPEDRAVVGSLGVSVITEERKSYRSFAFQDVVRLTAHPTSATYVLKYHIRLTGPSNAAPSCVVSGFSRTGSVLRLPARRGGPWR